MHLHSILVERGRVALNPATGSGEELLRSALNKAEVEALETLKVQYFQNATRYLAKGEYNNALAEIKRVLLIDPQHRLAREYEIRVTELQAARAAVAKLESSPLKEGPPAEAPPVADTTPEPVTKPRARRTWLYFSIIALLIVGTAGMLSLDKADDEEQPAKEPVATVQPQAAPQVEQPAETMIAEDPTPAVNVPLAVESKTTPSVEPGKVTHNEPVHKESAPPARSTKEASASVSHPAGSQLLAAAIEKKAELPSVPAPTKSAALAPMPEVKAESPQAPPAEAAAEADPFVAVERDPKIVRLEKVVLPELVIRNHMSGSVTAKVLIDKEGKPGEVQILASTSTAFEQPVIDAIGKSSFSPGVMGNSPVASWVVIPFKFK
jgi:TonB family protein